MLFWILVAIMLVLTVAGILSVLMKNASSVSGDTRAENVLIARERLAELQAELDSGALAPETFNQAKEELELVLLDDVQSGQSLPEQVSAGSKAGVYLVAILVPLLALAIYLTLGAPQHLDVKGPAESDVHAGASGETPTMEELLAGLQERIKANPEDPEGWFMLGRVESSLGHYVEAASAYEKLASLTDSHPAALMGWADSLAMSANGRVSGKPYELVRKVLEAEPDNLSALWLAGKGAREQGDLQNALYYWRRAEAGVASQEPEMLPEMQRLIEDLRTEAAGAGTLLDDPGPSAPEPVSSTSVTVEITLAPELASRVAAGDQLFLFARQPDGPPMPVAAIRKNASELPVSLVLDDGAVLTGGKLADYPNLKLAARVSKGGEPKAQSGDLQSAELIFSPADGGTLQLILDRVVP